MRFYKIHAYVRCHRLEKVEEALLKLGVSGFSFCRVKGMGEYANLYDPTTTSSTPGSRSSYWKTGPTPSSTPSSRRRKHTRRETGW